MASKSPFEVEGEEWETISEGVKRRIIPSDKRIPIVFEDPIEAQERFLRDRINALPDKEFARYVLTLRGSRGLHRADALARARRRILAYPGFSEYNSPLQWAISRDTSELLKKLISGKDYNDQEYKKGVAFDPNTVCQYETALYYAVSQNKIHNVLLLLDSGADPNIYSIYENDNDDDPWQTPLHCAAKGWHLDAVKLLLERDADINALSLLKGQSPLHHALLAARFWAQKYDWAALKSTVEYLIAAGADVNIRDDEKRAPLDIWLSIAEDHDDGEMQDIADLILKAGADINAVGSEGYSSFLLAAAVDGPGKLFGLLLGTGSAILDLQNDEGDSALHLVSERGALEEVKMLLDAGANPNIQSANGETPLHRVTCRRGYHEIVKSLLTRADPTIRRADGKTAIELAMLAGGIQETMQILRDHGSCLATIVLGWEYLKASALQSGTQTSRFLELVLGPEAAGTQTDDALTRSPTNVGINDPGPDCSSSPEMVHSETAAFAKSAALFETLSDPNLPNESRKINPKRLIDVTTGKIVPGDTSMKYIIGSYLWSPEKMPGLPQDSDGYEPIPETSKRVVEACKKYPDLIEMIPPEREGMFTLKYPAKRLYPIEPNSAYLTDVYRLLAREACRRGLRYVWIDSFCIAQNDEKDKAEQIPLMADYYRNADCCVVVSESLRRHIRPELDPSREFFDSGDSVTDRILGWAIGFHYNRVWVLQETRLAKEVVTRSGSVRIKTTDVLSPNFDKSSTNANKLWRHTVRDWEAVNETQSAVNRASQKLPLSGSRIDGGEPISTDFCMMLLRDRHSLYRHDRIYGALGLFPSIVRNSAPIDYSLSLSAVFATFVYLRIRSGDLIGLLSVRAPDHPPHYIQNSPSWLPSGYGFNYADVLDLQVDPELNFRAETDGKLYLQMIYIRVADCYQLEDGASGIGAGAKHGNIILTLMNKDGSLLPGDRRAAVEPVDPDYSLTSDKHFGTSATSVVEPPVVATQLSTSDAMRVAQERERRRLQIQIAARQNRAVIAMLGVDKRTMRESFPLDTIWLVLCTNDESRTWRRHGILVMTRDRSECFVGANGTESHEFCIA